MEGELLVAKAEVEVEVVRNASVVLLEDLEEEYSSLVDAV